MSIKTTLLVAIVSMAITACATKRYPIVTPLSSAEATLMTCDNLELELLRADQVEHKINQTGEFDAKTVLGVLGDFGIGNAMAKSEARTALAERRKTIHEAQVSKGCKQAAPSEQNQPVKAN